MSSGSSGKRVMVPEPSRSMFCFIRRICGVKKIAFDNCEASGMWDVGCDGGVVFSCFCICCIVSSREI